MVELGERGESDEVRLSHCDVRAACSFRFSLLFFFQVVRIG